MTADLSNAKTVEPRDLWTAFRYVVSPRALPAVLGCCVGLGAMDLVSAMSRLAGFALFLLGWGGLAIWCIQVIRESAHGIERRIRWREPDEIWDDLLDPLARSAAAVLVCFAPLLLLGSLGPVGAAFGLILACAALPVALGTLALGAALVKFDASAGLRRVRHEPKGYVIAALLSLIVLGAVMIVDAVLGNLSGGQAVVRVALVFALTIMARGLGQFLRMTRCLNTGPGQDRATDRLPAPRAALVSSQRVAEVPLGTEAKPPADLPVHPMRWDATASPEHATTREV